MKNNLTIRTSKWLYSLPFWLIGLVVLVTSRLATWLFPFDSDHWIFAYIGRVWAQGGTLYIDAWDHKSPLIFGYNAILYKLFGDDLILTRIFFTLLAILAAFLFYKTVRLLLNQLSENDNIKLAKISTLIFIVLTNTSQFTSSGNNNENIGILLLLGAIYLYLKYRSSANIRLLIASGFLAGFIFMLKVNFAILLLPLIADIVYQNWPKFITAIKNLLLFSIGIVVQLGFWWLYFYQQGTVSDFITATYLFNSKYITALGWDINEPGLPIFLGILALLIIMFAPFAIKSLTYIKVKTDRKARLLVPLMTLSVLLFIATAGTFYSYYFLIVMPFICLVIAATWSDLSLKFSRKIIWLVLVVLFIFIIISYRQLYNNFYGAVAQDASNMNEAALYVNARTSPNDTIFANMYGATFYQMAQRNSGSRFISASYLLVDYKFKFGYNLDALAIADFEKSKPKYIIVGSETDNLYLTSNPPMTDYINSNYRLEKSLPGYKILVRTN